jgi:hypothetical protein
MYCLEHVSAARKSAPASADLPQSIAPQDWLSIWFTRKLLPERYGPITTMGAIGAGICRSTARPSELTRRRELSGSLSTIATLQA